MILQLLQTRFVAGGGQLRLGDPVTVVGTAPGGCADNCDQRSFVACGQPVKGRDTGGSQAGGVCRADAFEQRQIVSDVYLGRPYGQLGRFDNPHLGFGFLPWLQTQCVGQFVRVCLGQLGIAIDAGSGKAGGQCRANARDLREVIDFRFLKINVDCGASRACGSLGLQLILQFRDLAGQRFQLSSADIAFGRCRLKLTGTRFEIRLERFDLRF